MMFPLAHARVTALTAAGLLLLALLCGMIGCGGGGDSGSVDDNGPFKFTVSPAAATLTTGRQVTFNTQVKFGYIVVTPVTWSVQEANGGTITTAGVYTAPLTAGTYHVVATKQTDLSKQIIVPVTVVPGGTRINPIDGAEMVWVPAGTFMMGTDSSLDLPNSYWTNECPAHQVTLSTGFWMYTYEVTVAQYRAFCAATGHPLPPFPNLQTNTSYIWPKGITTSSLSWQGITGWDDPTLQQHPIAKIYPIDVAAYTSWAGVQLPTEAQWEYAARGPAGYSYPWGGAVAFRNETNGFDATRSANYENSVPFGKSTWPVGSFPSGASWCGAQDLMGNISELCADSYHAYAAGPITDPTDPAPANSMSNVIRGVDFFAWSLNLNNHILSAHSGRSTVRMSGLCHLSLVGFRCVSTAPGP